MKINDEYNLTTDKDMNVILMKKYQKKQIEGEEVQYDFKPCGYYGNIKQALKDFVRKEMFVTELKDLKTIQSKIEELENTIDNLNI
ncbi:hypothetical protein [Terrisporobacter sp.]|uniref:hypothetical protein n=1 Tax=Terrisporobacter sp. TaxID=1965305 RepID=UPI00289D9247|nr:hypothetical protein [Terrisporobacter sp.]